MDTSRTTIGTESLRRLALWRRMMRLLLVRIETMENWLPQSKQDIIDVYMADIRSAFQQKLAICCQWRLHTQVQDLRWRFLPPQPEFGCISPSLWPLTVTDDAILKTQGLSSVSGTAIPEPIRPFSTYLHCQSSFQTRVTVYWWQSLNLIGEWTPRLGSIQNPVKDSWDTSLGINQFQPLLTAHRYRVQRYKHRVNEAAFDVSHGSSS